MLNGSLDTLAKLTERSELMLMGRFWLAKIPIAAKLRKDLLTALVTTLAIVPRLVTRYTCTLVTVLTITGCL